MGLSELIIRDKSAWVLIGSNIITIIIAATQNWSLISVMLLFWIQSVIIGFFTVAKMLSLNSFSTKGFTSNGQKVSENETGKISTAVFFSFHYGFFHFVYLIFLIWFALEDYSNVTGDFSWIMIAAILFFVNHLVSYWLNKKELEMKKPNLGQMMFTPYARIIPMHLTILFGFWIIEATTWTPIAIVFFLGLKTAADLVMHLSEHHTINEVRGKLILEKTS